MSEQLTNLQQFLLSVMVEDGKVDPRDGWLGTGLTAAEIETRAGGHFARTTIVRGLNALCRPTSGNADHQPRAAWARLVGGNGPARHWVATQEGAAALGADT